MNPTRSFEGAGRPSVGCLGILLAVLLLPAVAHSQLVSSGFPVSNPDWEILLTDYGYADLALDRRPGFVGREYLSGEWAAAVHYTGGSNPTNAIWFQPQWFYPDWVSNSDFGVETTFHSTGMTNANGFTIYQSVITNGDLRVTITYEMIDTGTGIEQGTVEKSAGGAGASITSNRYVFRQTYKIENISGETLNNFKFYQFLHGLEMSKAVYDDRDYGGSMSEYHYDITQTGKSLGFNSLTGAIVEHTDIMTSQVMMIPADWEVGYYGIEGVDDHVIGKPSAGVHLKVEGNSLDGTDVFMPPEEHWVSGAHQLDLSTLAPGAMVTVSVLLSLQTSFVETFPPINLVIRRNQVSSNQYLIDFEETTMNPFVGYLLRCSTNIATPLNQWTPVPVPYTIDVPQPGWNRFEVPIDPSVPDKFFIIQGLLSQ